MKLRHAVVSAYVLLSLLSAYPARAQGPDLTNVQIHTNKITSDFYTVDGAGGTIGVLTGPDGVLMVDSQYAPLTDKIVAAIRQLSNRPIKFMINTHLHGDHTGGNANLATMGVTIIARDELRARLAEAAGSGGSGATSSSAALPMLTYSGSMTVHMNGEQVELIPIKAAHTDGDTLVRFHAADVIMSGDFYRSLGYPNIDRTNGGTLTGMLEGLRFLADLAGPQTKIVPGHGAIVEKAAVLAQRDMILALRDRIAPMIQQGMTVEQVTAAKPTRDYDAIVVQPGTTGDRFVGQLYAEIKAAK
jgi:glyoxylase-like metal-dependent hydrolase (beta-lactamase superfamily II)